jgi:hypothetical protein
VSGQREPLYWNPMVHITAVFDSEPSHGPWSVADTFHGKWSERNWRNVPGPFYGAMTDNCWVGRLHAPRHVLYGDDIEYEQEFLYRQPRNLQDLRDVLMAMQDDPWGGWACDGDTFWTPDLVRSWWRERERLREWIDTKHRRWSISDREDEREAAGGLMDCLTYLNGELVTDLRVYVYFLDNGASPTVDDRLPPL